MAVLWVFFKTLLDDETVRKRSEYPIAEVWRQKATEDQRLPQIHPRIEGLPAGAPEHSLGRYEPASAQVKNELDEAFLTQHAWLDAGRTVARIPITEAMQRLIGKLPARPNSPPPKTGPDLPTSASSGRQSAGGPP
jgi:hypothetical protein